MSYRRNGEEDAGVAAVAVCGSRCRYRHKNISSSCRRVRAPEDARFGAQHTRTRLRGRGPKRGCEHVYARRRQPTEHRSMSSQESCGPETQHLTLAPMPPTSMRALLACGWRKGSLRTTEVTEMNNTSGAFNGEAWLAAGGSGRAFAREHRERDGRGRRVDDVGGPLDLAAGHGR